MVLGGSEAKFKMVTLDLLLLLFMFVLLFVCLQFWIMHKILSLYCIYIFKNNLIFYNNKKKPSIYMYEIGK